MRRAEFIPLRILRFISNMRFIDENKNNTINLKYNPFQGS